MDSRRVSPAGEVWLAGWLWNLLGEQMNVPAVIEYIKNQREHHGTQTFEEEYVSLLRLHGIDYDERFVFD